MWISPYHADLEIDNMKKFILDYKCYSQKCQRQRLRNIKQFVYSEEYLDKFVSERGGEMDDVMHMGRDEFIEIMLRMQFRSKMVFDGENGKMEISI